MTFRENHYIPFLKGKQGEFSALRELREASRSSLTPLIDIPRVPVKNRSKPLEDHLEKLADRVAKAWGGGRPLLVDLIDLPLAARTSAGEHYVSHFGDALAKNGVAAIPVTSTDRDDAYQAAIRGSWMKAGCIGLRLLPDDLETPSMLEDDMQEVLDAVGITPEQTHLLMDLRSLSQRDATSCVETCVGAVGALRAIDRFLSFTVAGSSMPQSLGELVKAKSTGKVRRKELDIWRQLRRTKGLARKPCFGDYGAVHPDLLDLDPTKITVAADIRYTVANGMLILRGSSVKHHPKGFRQYHGLAKTLVASSEYSGRSFSWADEAIYRKAHPGRDEGPGNKTTWVQIATNHHLEFVIKELPALVC